MANEIENDNLSFGIQDTVEMGQGSSQLISDLMEPETSTAHPDDIKDINTTDDPPAPPAPPKPKAKKDVEEEEEEEQANPLDNFLSSEEEEEEEEGAPPAKPKAAVKKEVAAEEEEGEEEGDDIPTSGTQFGALANDLIELGVFSAPEEGDEATPIETPEQFLEKFQAEKKKGAIEMVDNFIGQFGQDYQDAFDAIFVKGVNPQEYFTTAKEIENFSSLDLTDVKNQEKVMRKALTDQGFEPEDVDSEIERLRDYGDLESVSQRNHKVLIKKEAAALERKTQEAQLKQSQKLQVKQDYINNVNTVLQDKIKEKGFDGIPLTPKTANELQDFLLVDKWKTDSGETLTDFDKYILELKRPENHANKVKVALLLKILEKDPTLSTIQKTGVTKKSNQLFKEVSRQVSKTPNSSTKQNSSWWKE